MSKTSSTFGLVVLDALREGSRDLVTAPMRVVGLRFRATLTGLFVFLFDPDVTIVPGDGTFVE